MVGDRSWHMNERKRFILEATAGLFSHSELCRNLSTTMGHSTGLIREQ